jgi:hypothetical protein
MRLKLNEYDRTLIIRKQFSRRVFDYWAAIGRNFNIFSGRTHSQLQLCVPIMMSSPRGDAFANYRARVSGFVPGAADRFRRTTAAVSGCRPVFDRFYGLRVAFGNRAQRGALPYCSKRVLLFFCFFSRPDGHVRTRIRYFEYYK